MSYRSTYYMEGPDLHGRYTVYAGYADDKGPLIGYVYTTPGGNYLISTGPAWFVDPNDAASTMVEKWWTRGSD